MKSVFQVSKQSQYTKLKSDVDCTAVIDRTKDPSAQVSPDFEIQIDTATKISDPIPCLECGELPLTYLQY